MRFLFFVLAWVACPTAARAQAELDAARLAELTASAAERVAQVLALDPAPAPESRLVDRAELAAELQREWLGFAAQTVGGEGTDPAREAGALAQRIGAIEVDHHFARWSPKEQALLAAPETLPGLVRLSREPRLAEPEGVEVLLALEVCRAALEGQHGFLRRLGMTRQPEAQHAHRAVVAGACAVLVERAYEGSDAHRAALDAWRETRGRAFRRDDPVERQLERKLAVLRDGQAADGARFVRGVLELGGLEALGTALKRPPRDMLRLERPAEFLDPSKQSDVVYDFEGVIDAWAATVDVTRWSGSKLSLTPSDIDNAFGILGPQVGPRIRGRLEYTRVMILGPREHGEEDAPRSLTVGLYGFHSPVDAADFVATNEELSLRKDEAMRTGDVQVIASVYEDAVGDGWRGFSILKRLIAPGPDGERRELSAQVLYAAHGAQVLEVVMTNVDRPEAELRAAVDGVFRDLVQPREVIDAREAAARKAAEEAGQETGEGGGR